MVMTPPRYPRKRSVNAGMPCAGGKNTRRSELFEESKAAASPFIEWTVVIIGDEIESPALPHPLPPGDRHILTGKARENRSWSHELIRLLSEPYVQSDVVMFVGAFRQSYEAGRGKDHTGFTDVESHSILNDPGPSEIVSSADKNTLVAVHVLGGEETVAQSRNELLSRAPFAIQERIGAEARPEESSYARSERE